MVSDVLCSENCGESHDGQYGSGRFCSSKCARSYSTKRKRGEINEKISLALKSKPVAIKRCVSCDTTIPNKIDGKRNRSKYCNTCKKWSGYRTMFGKLGIAEDNMQVANKLAKKKITDLYHNKKWSLLMFYEEYGIRHITLQTYAKKNNIPLRNRKEAGKIAILNGRLDIPSSTRYNDGWHTTWSGEKIYYRSSYELRYAKKLDSRKVNYSVESMRLQYYDSQKNVTRVAIPDFYLEDENKIVEIKSDYTYDKQNMVDKFLAYRENGHECTLILEGEEIPAEELIGVSCI